MDWDGFFVCASSAVFVVAVFGTIVLLRWFRHREIMTLAEKGLLPAQYLRAPRGRGMLGWGVALAMLGLALTIGLWPMGLSDAVVDHYPLGFGPWMLAGLIPLFIGLGLLIIYFITRKENGSTPKEPADGQE